MKKFLASRGVDQIMIPAGKTGYLQTLDLAINKPFKDYLRSNVNDFIEHRLQRNMRGFVKPPLSEVVSWVRKSRGTISNECVANALRAGYLDKSHAFEDSYIGKHERLGPRDRSAIESQRLEGVLQALDLDCEQDVTEEDEIVVFD
ncbi:uncharacterized protein LOC108863958 [Galendromus occidentalis]|uniref:Uncharacterized protein LOC108863861 n=1 Tax=Galendromus occidentalis TaxID=34638 RepID=A0AAJ7L2U5_9ACAR|nr:uncharacterized protein LOC108863861 [Galendromus occidentalis]XP_018494239.1 uncharacterized protein LOC108863958 [Galendromus occidentalis]